MTVIELASRLIGALEGCKLKAYWDATGEVWTIGFGHTQGVQQGQVINLEQAQDFVAQDFAPLLAQVAGLPVLEAAALVSFGYNCGATALRRFLAGEIVIQDGHFVVGGLPYGELSGGQRILLPRRQLEAALILASREVAGG
jgi:GH24 family phage-related lysozyme (muramidase)